MGQKLMAGYEMATQLSTMFVEEPERRLACIHRAKRGVTIGEERQIEATPPPTKKVHHHFRSLYRIRSSANPTSNLQTPKASKRKRDAKINRCIDTAESCPPSEVGKMVELELCVHHDALS